MVDQPAWAPGLSGNERPAADQIDAAAYAAIIAQQDIGRTIRMQAPVVRG